VTLYIIIILSSVVFFSGLLLAVLFSYLGYRANKPQQHLQHSKIIYKRRRKGKYLLNNFTARIFFAEMERAKRLRIVNGISPLTTEKYSFTKTKLFDN